MSTYGWIGSVCLIASIAMAVVAIIVSKKQKSGQRLKDNRKRNTAIFITLYSRLVLLPYIKSLLLNIRKRLEVYNQSDEAVLRKRSVLLLFTTVFVYIGLVVLFWLVARDLLMLFLFVVLLSFIGDTVVEIFITNIHNKLLEQQVYYLELLRHKYYEQKSVEDANDEACAALNEKRSFEIYVQAERINDIMASSNAETELEKYYDTAPNKYLKMLAGILYITKEYGDTKVNGESIFVRCITYLTSEIKSEIYKRNKLKYALKGLNIISILPLFFLKPLRAWASNSFAPLKNFYLSRTGIILGVLSVIITIISYMALRRVQRFETASRHTVVKRTLEQRLYDAFLYRIVDKLIPRGYTLKRNKLTELIKKAMAPMNLYTLYSKRLILGCVACLMGIVMFFALNIYTRHTILYLPQMPQGYLGGKLSDEELKKLQQAADFDRSIILDLEDNVSDDDIKAYVMGQGIKNETEAQVITERIMVKVQKLTSNVFWWWQLSLCLLFFAAGYNFPILSLHFMVRVRKIDMEEEVSQFHTIILMLMHMDRVHVEEIMEWMEAFSVHFKEPLQKCLSNFSSGPYEALEELKSDVAFPPLISIVENLQLGCEDLGVKQAFEELENEIGFNRETRKENNERIVVKKKNLGNMIGFLPVYMLIILYLIIPMIVSGMESIAAFYRQLSQI